MLKEQGRFFYCVFSLVLEIVSNGIIFRVLNEYFSESHYIKRKPNYIFSGNLLLVTKDVNGFLLDERYKQTTFLVFLG